MRTPRLLTIVFALLISLSWVQIVSANGHTVTLYLGYLPEVSNWGPQDAAGKARVNVGEGLIELDLHGLPALDDQEYEVWLVTADELSWVSLGRFDADERNQVSYSAIVDWVPVEDYRYLVVTVEPRDDHSVDPSDSRAIAAVFPNADAVMSEQRGTGRPGVGADAAPTEEAVTGSPPLYLPETGNVVLASQVGTSAVVLAAFLPLVGVAGLSMRRGRE